MFGFLLAGLYGILRGIGEIKDAKETGENRYNAIRQGEYTYRDSELAERLTSNNRRVASYTYYENFDRYNVKKYIPDIKDGDSYYIDCKTHKPIANATRILEQRDFNIAINTNDGKSAVAIPRCEIKWNQKDYDDGKYGFNNDQLIGGKVYCHKNTGRPCIIAHVQAKRDDGKRYLNPSVSYDFYIDYYTHKIIGLTDVEREFINNKQHNEDNYTKRKINNLLKVTNEYDKKLKNGNYVYSFWKDGSTIIDLGFIDLI